MLNLYIDFDGVIMDTINVTYEIMKKQGIDYTSEPECKKFYRSLDWKKLLKECSAINDSWDCIQKLIDSNRFDISILTHVNSTQEAIEKVHCIREHFKDITIIPVPKEISKTKMIKSEGSVLVDDYVHNLVEWKAEGGIGIRFDLDMDGKGYPVIDRLDTLLDIIEYPVINIKQ